MTWRKILERLELIEEAAQQRPPETSNTAHYARIDLMNALAHARKSLEALAEDEQPTNERRIRP